MAIVKFYEKLLVNFNLRQTILSKMTNENCKIDGVEDEDHFACSNHHFHSRNSAKCGRSKIISLHSLHKSYTFSTMTCWIQQFGLLFFLLQFCCQHSLAFSSFSTNSPSSNIFSTTSGSTTTIASYDDSKLLETLIPSLNSDILISNDIQIIDYSSNLTLSQPRVTSTMLFSANSSEIPSNDDSRSSDFIYTPDPEYVFFR